MASRPDDFKPTILKANVRPARDGKSFDVYPDPPHWYNCFGWFSGPTFKITTIHLSCQSDTYRGRERKYGGIVIYARNSQSEWDTPNDTHCKSGYVVITQTDTCEFRKLKNKWREKGEIHGTIYRKAFDESCNDVKVVGEGFGIMDGEFQTSSRAFNPSHDDAYHNNSALMHKDSARYMEALVNVWKSAGPNFPAKQNYSVKELGD